jgi:DnaJ-class molecular chaperone
MLWYPKSGKRLKTGNQLCLVCNGSGKRRDLKTHLIRNCVLCEGSGMVVIKDEVHKLLG